MKKIIDFDVLFTLIKIKLFYCSNRSKCYQKIKELVFQANTPQKAQKVYEVASSIGIGKNIALAKWDKLSLVLVNKATSPDEIRKACKFASPKAILVANDKLYFLNNW